ncbi:MAG: hypothetical protein PHI85_09335, partial [Victivallaceae bacterium]|nr:hypothetical protein [Victivallaceae bacterium]
TTEVLNHCEPQGRRPKKAIPIPRVPVQESRLRGKRVINPDSFFLSILHHAFLVFHHVQNSCFGNDKRPRKPDCQQQNIAVSYITM